MTEPDIIARLTKSLQPDEPGPWIKHDGKGRPQKPGDFVEIEMRNGQVMQCCSAYIPWLWGYDDDNPTADGDVMRWRFRKEPPSLPELGGHVPELLATIAAQAAEIERLRTRLEVVDGWSEDADGIACRNDTIKLQDERIARQVEEIERLRAALEPFGAGFPDGFVDDEGWIMPMKSERIVDWFGPSDFRAARAALGSKP